MLNSQIGKGSGDRMANVADRLQDPSPMPPYQGTPASEAGLTRRLHLKVGLLGGLGFVADPRPAIAVLADAQPDRGISVAVANHWSYIGIGWQLGLESCVLSVVDSLEMADRPPGVKTCINLDARAYELMSKRYPAVIDRLKKYLAEGKVELVGGTYSQPMGTGISGESNIRQIVYGREAIRRSLGYEMVTFLEEEEFSHPQVPQILAGAGYQYASLAQVDTWGRAGVPVLELNVFEWRGIDGTSIPTTPKNRLPYRPPDLHRLASTSSEDIEKLRKLGKPLLLAWEEFGWEPHESPRYLVAPQDYLAIPKQFPVEFVTLREYMEKYGRRPEKTIYLNMDAWRKVLFWGIGGDQLRLLDRKIEALLLAAETFDAVSARLGSRTSMSTLEEAWKSLMTAQSHDVCLCEYSRYQGDTMPPVERAEDFHNFAWGAIGYNHLDEAKKLGQSVLTTSLNSIAARVDTRHDSRGKLVTMVFNSCGWARTGVARTGRVHFGEHRGKDLVARDSRGREVLSQLIDAERDSRGDLVSADVAFRAENVPSVGYDTYYIDLLPAATKTPSTDLRVNVERLELENTHLKIRLDAGHGALISLIDKSSGRELLDASKGPFPAFKGRPNPAYPVSIWRKYRKDGPKVPESFDSSLARASIEWMETGPLRATVRATHSWPMLKFESMVTLHAHSPQVEVVSRLLPSVPPAVDLPSDGGRLPLEIREGYWLTFAPGFPVSKLRRDFPFGCEPTSHRSFEALSLLDMEGPEQGLLLLHGGTQYFKRDDNGVIWNLLLREWESYWSGEFGWPRYAEYRHALLPHPPGCTPADLMRASVEFSQELRTVVLDPRNGTLPQRKSFLIVKPEAVQLSAFRMVSPRNTELRFVHMGGAAATAEVALSFPIGALAETDLLGRQIAAVSPAAGRFRFQVPPWKIRTFRF